MPNAAHTYFRTAQNYLRTMAEQGVESLLDSDSGLGWCAALWPERVGLSGTLRIVSSREVSDAVISKPIKNREKILRPVLNWERLADQDLLRILDDTAKGLQAHILQSGHPGGVLRLYQDTCQGIALAYAKNLYSVEDMCEWVAWAERTRVRRSNVALTVDQAAEIGSEEWVELMHMGIAHNRLRGQSEILQCALDALVIHGDAELLNAWFPRIFFGSQVDPRGALASGLLDASNCVSILSDPDWADAVRDGFQHGEMQTIAGLVAALKPAIEEERQTTDVERRELPIVGDATAAVLDCEALSDTRISSTWTQPVEAVDYIGLPATGRRGTYWILPNGSIGDGSIGDGSIGDGSIGDGSIGDGSANDEGTADGV